METTSRQPQMILLIGIPASGKTTFAATRIPPEYVRISLDVLHSRAKEAQTLAEAMAARRDIVVDNTNVNRVERERFITPARQAGYRVACFYFQSSVPDCLRRNAQRTGAARIPEVGVRARAKALELPSIQEGFDELSYVSITETGFNVATWSVAHEDK